MSALKKQRIDLRLNEDDKHMIEEAAAMTNQSISQFMVSTASVPLQNALQKLLTSTVACSSMRSPGTWLWKQSLIRQHRMTG